MPRRAKKKTVHDRMYYREGRGWYLDLRDLGRGRVALIDRERGEKAACENVDRAFEIAQKVMEMHGEDPPLGVFAECHLSQKARRRRKGTVARDRIALDHIESWATGRLGRPPRLSDVTKRFVLDYMAWRGPKVAAKTLAHELHALSNLMKRAVGLDLALLNPIPKAKELEGFELGPDRLRDWYEVGEAARLLHVCAELDTYRPFLPRRPIVAT
ncbi:MAG: phage integrase SAM-like domain-containing protein, partial [Planctomycetota bacterium]